MPEVLHVKCSQAQCEMKYAVTLLELEVHEESFVRFSPLLPCLCEVCGIFLPFLEGIK